MYAKSNKKNGVKLLSAVMVFAVAIAGFSIILNDDADAAIDTSGLIDITDSTAMEGATGATYSSTNEKILTLSGYTGNKGFYYSGTDKLTIIVSGTNTITMDRGTGSLKTNDVSAIVANGAVDIKADTDASTEDILNITMTGSYSGNSGSEHTYGIYTNGDLKVQDIELNMSISTEDRYAFAILSKGTAETAITFNNVTGEIVGGNRAIQSTGKTTTFINSTMTLKGGEKAIQAKDANGTLVLDGTSGSNITLELIDYPGSNTGEDDRFGLKVNTLTVSANSTLTTQGLHKQGNAITSAPAGKVIVNGGYEQVSKNIYDIAGLYFDNQITEFKAKTGTPAVGSITLGTDAQAYNIAIDGQSAIESINTSAKASELGSEVTSKLNSTTEGNVQIVISSVSAGSNDADKTLTISDLKSKNVTLVLPDSVNLKAVEVTVKGTESVSILRADTATNAVTYTFKHGTENTTTITDLKGSIIVTPGSVNVDLVGSGTISVVAGTTEVSGTITGGTATITSMDNAAVDITGVSVASGATLNLNGINVTSSGYISNEGTISFGAQTTIEGSVYIDGGNVTGTIAGGNLVVKGNVTVSDALTINNDAKMNISKDSTVTISGSKTLTNNGTINLNGIIDNSASSAKLQNDGKIVYLDKEASIKNVSTATNYGGLGSIDGSAIASDASLSGDIETVTTYGIYQTVTINANTTFVKGTQITIEGALIIAEGVTLTIQDGAQLVISGPAATMENNGNIIVESDVTTSDLKKDGVAFAVASGFVLGANSNSINNGTISANYVLLNSESGNKTSITVTGKLENNGTITVSENNKVDGTITNKVDGTVSVNGEATTVNNEGTVIINGAVTTVNNIADKATVSVVSFNGTMLIITDDGFVYNKTEITPASNNSIIITKNAADKVGTITVVSEVVKKTAGNEKKMTVSGTLSETYTANSGNHAAVTITGTVYVADELTIADNIVVTMTGATLDVSGTVTAKLGTQITGGTLNVTGSVVVGTSPVGSTVNGAMYKVVVVNPASTTYYYSTLDKAISGAAEAGINEVTATGNVAVKSDVTVPAGMTVKQTNGTITVGSTTDKGVTMTVADGGKMQASGTIDVKGTLYVENKKTGINRGANITCEVIAEGTNDVRYTNLNSAIASAGTEPVTITLHGTTTITSDMTIPENVTVDMNDNAFIVEGAKLTIDGKLLVDSISTEKYNVTNVTDPIAKEGKIVLNGYIVSEDPLAYNATTARTPAGVYYTSDDGYVITSIDNIADAIKDAENSTVNVNGENTVGDVTLVGTSDEPAVVNVNGKLAAGTITMDFARIVFANGIQVDATIANANGSFELSEVKTGAVTTFVAGEDSDNVKVLTLDSGTLGVIDNNKSYRLVADGDVAIKAVTLTEVAGKDSMTIDGKVTVTGTSVDLKNVTVNGTLVAANGASTGGSITATTIVVNGTLDAAVATEAKPAAGTISVGTLYAGVAPDFIIPVTTSADPVITGNVTVSAVAYILNGVAVPESISDASGVKVTKYVVEGADWMTAYAKANTEINDVKGAPITDAKLGIQTGTGSSVTTIYWLGEDQKTNVVDATLVGDNGFKTVYANINYNIYTVSIIGDAGIGSVAIDGVVLAKGAGIGGENVFTIGSNLKAGTHTVTFVLKDGFSGSPVLYKGGESLNGLTFTLSGTKSVDTNITFNLSGTTPAATPSNPGSSTGSSSDDGMSITDYLLIVLVVLIVIMAILVAIRMMRS